MPQQYTFERQKNKPKTWGFFVGGEAEKEDYCDTLLLD